ncbi:hypothetical protein [Lysinibacillus capsici]|uniref:hypothetical protein n=1 Tax=Lysinibacillus capsici TaxID=2115968 RepID=UPI00248196A9|nr:hypothetical protein [Lysinibacillus capsici]
MKSYEEITEQLRKPFPPGTVKVSSDGKRGHIPVQVYMSRLEDVAKSQWHWRIIGDPVLNFEKNFVIVKGEITLVDTVRQGLGIAKIAKVETSSIKNALMTAESEAFRDACDKFKMGWQDLAPYRDWSTSPVFKDISGLHSNEGIVIDNFDPDVHSVMPSVGRECIKCKKPLSHNEELLLSLNGIKFAYCKEHIPQQLIKKQI